MHQQVHCADCHSGTLAVGWIREGIRLGQGQIRSWADLDGRGIHCIWGSCPNRPYVAVKIYTSKRAGIVLSKPIVDKGVAER